MVQFLDYKSEKQLKIRSQDHEREKNKRVNVATSLSFIQSFDFKIEYVQSLF